MVDPEDCITGVSMLRCDVVAHNGFYFCHVWLFVRVLIPQHLVSGNLIVGFAQSVCVFVCANILSCVVFPIEKFVVLVVQAVGTLYIYIYYML